MSTENTELIINSVSPFLNTLSDTSTRDRPVKRRAIEAVKKETSQIRTWTSASTAASDLLAHLIDSLLICTESSIESVREQTVGILDSLIEKCSQGGIEKSVIEKLFKTSIHRLKVEPTEEIRVAWMELCVTLINELTAPVKNSMTEEQVMELIQVAGQDPFSEVLKRAAKLIILYARYQPKAVDYACDRMIRLTIPLLTHKHTAVRVLGIKAMESVLMVSPKGLHVLFHDTEEREAIVPALIYDSSALVRDNLFTILGKLLCNWSPRDRYQYGEKLLPIILSGTLDELPSIQSTCKECLKSVGGNCTRDLFEADIIHELPTDERVLETTGLKHLVHMCFDKSLIQLLTTELITVRQATGLDCLRLFLEYSDNENDLLKNIKKLIHYLMVIYISNKGQTVITEKVLDIIHLLATKLPCAVYLDVLLAKLESKYLVAETNGFPGSMTVLAVMTFLTQFIQVTKDKVDSKRALGAIDKPYLNQYIMDNRETIQQIKMIKSLLSSSA